MRTGWAVPLTFVVSLAITALLVPVPHLCFATTLYSPGSVFLELQQTLYYGEPENKHILD
jgi:hypothetical protein